MDKELMKELAKKYPQHVLAPYGDMIQKVGLDAVSTFAEEFGGTNIADVR